MLFFINAFNDGMACSSCLGQDTCERAKCGPNKRCVMRHNRPKCICAPTCTKQLQRGPKRKGRLQSVATPTAPSTPVPAPDHGESVDEQQEQLGLGSPHHHRQNIKVINLSESQRNRRQYFADDGGRRRAPFAVSPRQLRFTDTASQLPGGGGGRRNVKKSSDLSDQRRGSARPASKGQRGEHGRAWKGTKQPSSGNGAPTDERQHNLLESVTLAVSGKGDDRRDSNHSSRSTTGGSSQHESRKQSPGPAGTVAMANCTSSSDPGSKDWSGRTPAPGCSAPSNWTGGERLVLLQSIRDPSPAIAGSNGTAAGHRGGSRRRTDLQMLPPPTTMASHAGAQDGVTRRHHKKLLAGANRDVVGNSTRPGITGQPPKPFVAFGKPKLLRVPKEPRRNKQNGTVALRVPRREPQYLEEVFVVDNHHHFRRPDHRIPMDDILGNEIMLHTGFYNPVCGTDGKTYKTECQLKKRACRQELTSLMVAYKGHCQTSCKFVKCPNDQQCIEDQNATPHCVTCAIAGDCRGVDRSPKSMVCGTDGITYPNVCELKRQACLIGRAIPVAYRGRCNEAATCETIKCKDRQQCLTDLKTHKPRCVSCSYKCPRMKRQQQHHQHQQQQHHQQGHAKPSRNAKNNHLQEQTNVKLCGTNNRTYHSRCHMLKDSCNTGFYIDVLHSGSCAAYER
uniref:Kazal-like domain-containing protein n=2 Tax=Anopheles albimanus TaxID=7167 RepID=A0A3F2YQ73_ANOAL